MPNPLTQVAQVATALTAEWIRTDRGHDVALRPPDSSDSDPLLVELTISGVQAALAIVPLFETDADPETLRRKAAVEERLAARAPPPLALWVPPLATLPDDGLEEFVGRVAEAAAGLAPGGRGEVAFPVTLDLQKRGDDGSYLSAVGALSEHWARFTNQVFGQFGLDSRTIHRLPDDPDKVTQLIDFIVLLANGIRAPGRSVDVAAEDTWVVQRLPDLTGPTLIVASPHDQPDDGASVRKAVRAGVRRASEALRAAEDATRVLTFVGIYRSMAAENAAIALRGMDPMSFNRLDFVCLGVDGKLKPLFGPKPTTVLASGG